MSRTTKLDKPGAMHGLPEAPADMSVDAKALWKRTVLARPASQWTATDAAVLKLYITAVLDVERLNAEIEATGEVMTAGNGTACIHPLVMVRARREKLMLDAATKLRLVASARQSARRAEELHRFAGKSLEADAAMDADDLLASPSKERLQ